MKNKILALLFCLGVVSSAIGQPGPIGRGTVMTVGGRGNNSGNITTTNSPFNGAVLTTDGSIYYWSAPTNLQANATNAINNFNGLGTNTDFYGTVQFFNAVEISSLFVSGAATNQGKLWLEDDLDIQGSIVGAGNISINLEADLGSLFVTNKSTHIGIVDNRSYTTNNLDAFFNNFIVQSPLGTVAFLGALRSAGPSHLTNTLYVVPQPGLGTNFFQVNATNGTALVYVTSNGVFTTVGDMTNRADVGVGGNAVVTGQIFSGDTFTAASDALVSGPLTISDLTASTLLKSDASKNVISIPNGTGMLTNDGAGVFGYLTIPAGSGLPAFVITNNYAVGNTFTNLGSLRQEGAALFLNDFRVDGVSIFTDNVGISATLSVTSLDVTNTATHRTNTYNRGTNYFNYIALPNIAAGSTLGTDANSNIVAVAAGTGSTNNITLNAGTLVNTNSFISHWHAGVDAKVYATNGNSQFFTLGSHTNLSFVPYTGADATNDVGVAVAFTQNSTGGFYPTNNGQVLPINTNALRSTMAYFSIVNGATNVSVAYPFSMGIPTNLSVIEFNEASGTYTNVISMGSGPVMRSNAPAFNLDNLYVHNIYVDQSGFFNSIVVTQITSVNSIKYANQTNYVPAVSNIVLSFSTNRYVLKNQEIVIFTNIVEEAESASSDLAVHVHNTTGGNLFLMWPAYGAQHGYFFQTNINNPILSTTTLATGRHGVASFTCFGSNIFATWTEWP